MEARAELTVEGGNMTTSDLHDKDAHNVDEIIGRIVAGALAGLGIVTAAIVLFKFMTALQ